MLATLLEEVILLDADVFFLRKPDELFDDPGYLATGTLFFYGCTIPRLWTPIPDLMRHMMPFMSSHPPRIHAFLKYNSYEQESGVVVLNTRTRFLGPLATCNLNSKWERELWSYRAFYGDKETFCIGFKMIKHPMRSCARQLGRLGSSTRQRNAQSASASCISMRRTGP
ncbi:hypothetical protein BGZ74_009643 [Mortierella antarctica]|nr:hypothetical protein BGZ74_009643 [Mortierella antarctica]